MQVLEIEPETIFRTTDINIGKTNSFVPCRFYQYSESINLPLVVFAHGGGWVLGGLNEYDNFCRRMANSGSCNVISIGYRLAPENPYPAALEDVIQVFSSLAQIKSQLNIKPVKIIGAGDSAGGNLIAVSSTMLSDNIKPSSQILIYPVTDVSEKRLSYEKFGKNFLLDENVMDWFINSYVANSEATDPHISVIRSSELGRSPETFLITAGLDPLRDEGNDYAKKLETFSIRVTHRHYESMLHGFMGMPKALNASKLAFAEVGAWIQSRI